MKQHSTFNYISHEALGGGVSLLVGVGPAAVELGGDGAVSLFVSGGGELHRGSGCGFKRDKSQRGERMRNSNRD